ncbi:hypothetical protein BV96_03935 [Sphingomonas paucimobilis]|nr:hypothetical protein BV96_03935 [Sphingomonas paucimobilis]
MGIWGIMASKMPAAPPASIRVTRSQNTGSAMPMFLDCARNERAFAPDVPLNQALPHTFLQRP